MNYSRLLITFSTVVFLLHLISCRPFELSPYEIPPLDESETNLNAKNIGMIISGEQASGDSFVFAIIADTHVEYHLLKEVVRRINKDPDIRFVMHLGDMTDGGLYKEFHWTNEEMSELHVPYIMVIGNHDYLSNGELIYSKMYGPGSFTFTYHKTRFVCFDDVIWENENTSPDFNWLRSALSDHILYRNIFVFSHIPPFADQFNDENESRFTQALTSARVDCSFHGHNHVYTFGPHYSNSPTLYFVADYLKRRHYYKVHVADTSFSVEAVSF
jgi:3',5'-cyclic-AMP phosphodiesterase